ncbi:MAG: 50S ribosomal protein L6 [Myxococcaceae bacterium]|nr:50S ribosomal protein L6 [Myxococcaceae bacterium]MBH2006958.1 50S ribosomal protein L6 [Myxococcaceae bacterium]
MSRIGKQPIEIPEKVKVLIQGHRIKVEGPKGQLERELHSAVTVTQENAQLLVTRQDDTNESKSIHGLSRTLVSNMVHGVTHGFVRELAITGVGYRAEAKDREIHLALGFSHPVVFKLPDEVTAHTDAAKTSIKLESINKEILGETAAKIRSFRPPEPYRGKGIRYSDEVIKRKEGKSAGK